MRDELPLLVGQERTDDDGFSVAERNMARRDSRHDRRQMRVDFEAGGQHTEQDVVLRRTEINRLKKHFVKMTSFKPPIAGLLSMQGVMQRTLGGFPIEVTVRGMKRHDLPGWIGEKKKVASRHLREISRSVLNGRFVVGGHQRFDIWETRRDFGRLREHSLALLRQLLKGQKGTVELFIDLSLCVFAEVILDDQQTNAGEYRGHENQGKEKFRTQPNLDHRRVCQNL